MMATASEAPVYLTVKEAAAYLRVSTGWVYLQAAKGALPCIHVGRAVRFRRDELDKWMAKNSRGPRD